MTSSMARWLKGSLPINFGAIAPSILAIAFATPLPRKREPPSRNSTASKAPVDAPLGTAALANAPSLSDTSTSTVGLPRESSISRALIARIRIGLFIATGAESIGLL